MAAALADRRCGCDAGVSSPCGRTSARRRAPSSTWCSRHLPSTCRCRLVRRCSACDGPRPTRSTRRCAGTGRRSSSPATSRLGMPVMLVPALPALGRVCVGGVVLNDGRPVHEGVAAMPVSRSSARGLPSISAAAGAMDVVELAIAGRRRRSGSSTAGRHRRVQYDAELDAKLERWSMWPRERGAAGWNIGRDRGRRRRPRAASLARLAARARAGRVRQCQPHGPPPARGSSLAAVRRLPRTRRRR